MDLSQSDRENLFQKRVCAFVDDEIRPLDPGYAQKLAAGDRWSPIRGGRTLPEQAHSAIMKRLADDNAATADARAMAARGQPLAPAAWRQARPAGAR